MASAEDQSTVTCASPREVHARISERLEAEGVTSTDSGEEDRLLHLWKICQKAEMDLKAAEEREEKLKASQAAEMKEVESYVEHIRQLSDDRETAIQDLETDNEQLKASLDHARSELTGQVQKEASEMLVEQGLSEIATATPSEQVAYLLVERARLLDQAEGASASLGQSDAEAEERPDTSGERRESQELKQILEQERSEFEQVLSKQRERASSQTDLQRKEHEEEISSLMDENSKLEEDLQQARGKSVQLEKQIERLKREQNEEQDILEDEREDMERERDAAIAERKVLAERLVVLERAKAELESERDSWKDSHNSSRESASTPVHFRPSSPLRSPNDVALRKVIEDKTKLEGEMIHLRGQIRSLRDQKEAMEEEVKKAHEGGEKLQVSVQQLQLKNKNLRQELEEVENQLDDAETAAEEAKKKEKEITLKYKVHEGETSRLREEVKRIDTLQELVDALSADKSDLSSTLEGVQKEMRKILAEKEDLSTRAEQLTDSEQRLSNQVTRLKAELSALEAEREELCGERDDLMTSQTTQDEAIATLKSQLSATQRSESGLREGCEKMEKDVDHLKQRLQEAESGNDCLKDTAQRLATQELIVSHLKEEKAGLQSQVTDLQTQLQWVRQTEQSLLDSQQTTQRAYTDAEKRLTREIDALRATLEKRQEELEAVKLSHSEEHAARTSLANHLSAAESKLQEISREKRDSEEKSQAGTELKRRINDLEDRLAEETRTRTELQSHVQDLQSQLEEESNHKTKLETKLQDSQNRLEKEIRRKAELEAKTQDLENQIQEMDYLSETRLEEETTHSAETFEEEKKRRVELEDLVKKLREQTEKEITSLGNQLREEKKTRSALQDSVQQEHTAATLHHQRGDEPRLEQEREATTSQEETASLRSELKQEKQLRSELEGEVTSLRSTVQQEKQLCSELMKEKQLCSELQQEKQLCSELQQEKQLCSELQQEKQLRSELEGEVTSLRSTVQQEKQQRSELEFKVQELEELLDDAKVDADNLQHSLKVKVSSLDDRCQQLQDDLFAAQDELTALQDKYKQASAEADDARCEMLKQQAQAMEQASQVAMGAENVEELESSLSTVSKQLQDALNELNLANTKIAQLEDERSKAMSQLNRIQDDIKTQSSQKTSDAARISELEKQLAKMSELEKQVAKMSELEKQLAKMSELEKQVAKMSEVEKQLVKMSELENQVAKMSELEKQVAKMSELENQVAKMSDLEKQVAKMSELENQVAKMSELEKQVAKMSDLEKQLAKMSELENQLSKMSELENQLAKTSAQLSKSEAEAKTLAFQKETDAAKITELETQCSTTSAQLSQLRTENKSLAFQKDIDSAQILELQSSEKAMKRDLQESVAALTEARSQLSDKTHMLDGVVKEMKALNRELQYLRESSNKEMVSRSQHGENVKVMEVKVRQLEQEKRETTRKLADAADGQERLSQMLEKEKSRHSGPGHQSARYVEQLEMDLNAAHRQIRGLRDDLQHSQSSAFKLEADSSAQTAKYETMVVHLETEVSDLRQQQRRESDTMGDKVANATCQYRHAHTELMEKEKTITELRREVLHAQGSVEKLQARLSGETHTRSDVENRNITLEQEMNKVWGQVRTLMERNNHLEGGKKATEEELDKKSARLRQLESTVSNQDSTLQSTVRELKSRAECAENHVSDLQDDLSSSVTKATTLEQQLQKAESQLGELSEKSQQLATLRNHLEGERLQRTLLEQRVGELQHQVSLLRQHEQEVTLENKDLQSTLQDLQRRLRDSAHNNHSNDDDDIMSPPLNKEVLGPTHKTLLEQIAHLQEEVKSLQFELLTSGQRRDLDLQRYEERKHRTKTKMMKAREERSKYLEHLQELEDDLRLTRAALNKELEWKDQMDLNYKQLLQEKRGLVSQMSEQEEVIGDKTRSLSMLGLRASYLEDENRHLQKRVDTLAAQKQTLDKLVKDFQHNRDREVTGKTLQPLQEGAAPTLTLTGGSVATATSGLGSSVDVTWEQDQAEDGTLVFRHGSTFHSGSSATESVNSSHHASPHHPYPHHHHHHNHRERHFGGGRQIYRNVHSPSEGPRDLGFYPVEGGEEEERGGEVVHLYAGRLESDEGEGEGSGDEFEA